MPNWPEKSHSVPGQRTRVIKKPGSFDNDDLKMRSDDATEFFKNFITVWEEGPDIATISKKLGLPIHKAKNRASTLRRRHGIPLKLYSGMRIKPVDYKALAEFHRDLISSAPKSPPQK